MKRYSGFSFLPTNKVTKKGSHGVSHSALLFDSGRLIPFGRPADFLLAITDALHLGDNRLLAGGDGEHAPSLVAPYYSFFGATVSSSLLFYPTSFPSNSCYSPLVGYNDGGRL